MKKYFYLLPCLWTVVSCSSLRVISLNPAVEPPELRGDKGVQISTRIVGAHSTEATSDASARPPNLDNPSTATAFDIHPGFSFSPHPRFEAGLEVSPVHWNPSVVVKWQPLGQGKGAAQVGNVPFALYARAGRGEGRNNGDQKGEFGPGGYPWRGSISETYLHVGASVGYRPLAHMLLYAGLAGGQYWLNTKITQDPGAGDPGGEYKSNLTGNALTGGFGLLFNWRVVQFYVSEEVTHVDYNKTHEKQDVFLHAGITITPGGSASAASPAAATP